MSAFGDRDGVVVPAKGEPFMRCRRVLVLTCVIGATAARVLAQETRKVPAGPEYAASGTARRWLGEGYRDIWTEPFEAPVLDLAREGAGLKVVRPAGRLPPGGTPFLGG